MDNASAATSPEGKGGGSVPEAAPRLRARQVQPGEGFPLILPTSFFFKALQLVLFPTDSGENSSFFSQLLPGARSAARPEVGRRAAGGPGARTPGAAATWPPEPGPWRWSFVGRAAPGAEPGLPHTRTAAAAPEARVAPGGGWGTALPNSKDTGEDSGGTGSDFSPFCTPLG